MLDKQDLAQEVNVGVMYSALMSAVALFFTGVLISQFSDFDQTIKVPLVFLVISTYAFIFSATIYSNASSEITLNKLRLVEKYMIYGKNSMELLGLYPFILATPLVIGAVTNDSFLRTITILVAISGFAMYSQSKFSILEKELSRPFKRTLTFVMVSLAIGMYYFQTALNSNALKIYSMLAVIFLVLIFSLAYYFSTNSKQYKKTFFRPFQDRDAEELSKLIINNLKHRDALGKAALEESTRQKYSAESMQKLASKKKVIVAEFNNQVVGLAALSEDTLSTVFTATTVHRKGVGRLLVEHLEDLAVNDGIEVIKVRASKIDRNFYERLGYEQTQDSSEVEDDRTLMTKRLTNS